ncbi:LuxR C-terminal-related transcriptional regulator [Kribbella steppae]|uniref:LuxR C-terminal-related transcriptional regulator n=1 Tax=Kribbella steppae TaxID=2512223 RepID=UPI00130E19F5|nr:LuxR C-terminal-related transcriptional regulator [Kribbella steppae]
MSAGVQRPLTLVSAPAGFGKTMLLASWEALFTGPGTVRHIALDVTSEQPEAVLRSVLDGLQRRGSILADEPVLLTRADQPGQPDPVRDSAVEQEALVLVVDCGDLTVTAELAHSLDDLIRGSAGRVRIVLLTRSDPLLPLHRYRLDGTVTEIRAADLAFTTEEATALMRRQQLTLTPKEIAELRARTDGWPAGLMFAAMSLSGKTDTEQAIKEFRGDAGNVAAYLMSEVLDAQPHALREFLLRTSIVDEIRPGLAEALTSRPCDLRSLEFMSRGNAFVQPVPGTEDTYSYQSLFREFLRAQLLFERAALVPQLHRTAAGWFAHNGRLLAAIRHAIAARRWGDAARYLVDDLDFARLLVGGERRLLETLFADLPDDLDGVEASVVRAARAVAAFDVELCASELGKARTWLDRGVTPRTHACQLAITVLQAVTASLEPNVDTGLDAALAAEAALRAASPGSVSAHPELKLLVAGCKGRVLLQRGDFQAASAAFAEGVALAEGAGLHEALADFLGMAALVEAVWGHLRQAGEIAAKATALAESGAHLHEPQAAIVAQAWVRTDQGDLTAARDLMHRAGEAEPTYDARVLETSMALVRARLLRAGGDVDLAGAELRAARNGHGAHGGDWLGQALVVDEAKILVAEHQPDQAISKIERSGGRHQVESLLVLQRAATETGRRGPALPAPTANRAVALDTQVDGWLVQAAEAIRTGDPSRTRVCLERALRLAAPEQLRRPFSEAPPSVQRLLGPTGDLIGRHPWLRADGSSGEQSSQVPAGLIRTATLTRKEHEVLEYLAELLTTEEIASTMYVSVNTVRSHVRSVLRKLSASRRNDAVRRAWELGLLPTRPESEHGPTTNALPLRAGPIT